MLAAAIEGDADGIAGLMLVHDGADLLRIADRLAIHSHNKVAAQKDWCVAHVGLFIAAVQAGPFRRAAGDHFLDQDAGIDCQADLRRQIRPNGIRNDTQRGPLDAPVAGEISQHRFGRVDGDGKADAGALLRAVGGDHGVDADDLAARVEQRTAGVAGVDSRVGLDSVFDQRALRASDRADGADDAPRHGAAEAEGIADGVDLLAHRESAGISQRDRLEVGRVNLQQGQVMHLVSAHHLGLVAALVAQHHLDAAIGALDNVEVGEHVAGLVEDEPRTLALLRHRSIKEVENQGGGGDVDH